MKRLKKGERVVHPYLGEGEFIKYVGVYLSLVRGDKKPSVRYNMGENPTCVINSELKREPPKGKE